MIRKSYCRNLLLLPTTILVMLLLSVGCQVGIEICEESEHPHVSPLIITYEWPAGFEEGSERMVVLANRPISTVRYLFGWLPEYNKGHEFAYYTFDSTEEKTTYFDSLGLRAFELATDTNNVEECSIRIGTFQMLTYNCSPYFSVDTLYDFLTERKVSSQAMGVRYHTWSVVDSIDPSFQDWLNFNPEYPYARDIGPLFFDEQIVESRTGEPVLVNFSPHTISQRIHIDFVVVTDEPALDIDSIRGEISGVVLSKQLFTGYLDMNAEHSCRVIFTADLSPMTSTDYDCRATIDVLGLTEPVDAQMQTGPGILHIAAYTQYTDPESGKKELRNYHWSINMYQMLQANPVTMQTADRAHHVNTSPEETLVIPYSLKIYLHDYDDNQDGVTDWIDHKEPNDSLDLEF